MLLLLLLFIVLFLTEQLCLCELSRWVALAPHGGWRPAWHSEIPAWGEMALGAGGEQAEEDWKGRGWQLRLRSRYNPEILKKKKVIKQTEAELKGHFRAAMW